MKVRVLGCSGGIGQNLHTSSYMIDGDILLDAGSGVGNLTLEEMQGIKHIFVTHSHLDHVLSIPLLVDTLFSALQDEPLYVHARVETLDVLRKHVFNWQLWPDFSELPDKSNPVLKFIEMKSGDDITILGRRIEMVEVNHTVPACGYIVESTDATFVYSGDTTTNDGLWNRLNELSRLDLMFIETAFSEDEREMAKLSKHYCPSLLAADLKKLKHTPKIGLSHFKPGEEKLIFQQCCDAVENEKELRQLSSNDIFQI